MIAATIGFGKKHVVYAERAADAMRRFTGLETVVFGEDLLERVRKSPEKTPYENDRELCCIAKWWLFDALPDAESILWFDSDYHVINYWNPQKFDDMEALVAVRDRVTELMTDRPGYHSDPLTYFNAGFFIANRRNHRRIFEFCRNCHDLKIRRWYDQCTINHAIQKLGIAVHYLDRRHNCMDYGPVYQRCDIKAIHSSWNFPHYEQGTAPANDPVMVWDSAQMRKRAGFYRLYNGSVHHRHLFYDGVTDQGETWWVDREDQIRFCDGRGNRLIHFEKIQRVG